MNKLNSSIRGLAAIGLAGTVIAFVVEEFAPCTRVKD